jgi:hypothetical protein
MLSVMDASLNEHSTGILNIIYADPHSSYINQFQSVVDSFYEYAYSSAVGKPLTYPNIKMRLSACIQKASDIVGASAAAY